MYCRAADVDGPRGPVVSFGYMVNNVCTYNPKGGTIVRCAPALAATVEAFLTSLVGKNRSAGGAGAYRTYLGQLLAWLTDNDGTLAHPTQVTKADVAAISVNVKATMLSGVIPSAALDLRMFTTRADTTRVLPEPAHPMIWRLPPNVAMERSCSGV
jgi:hypothetical protein